MDWFVKKFLLSYLKKFLDKFPLDGLKTVLGIILIVVGELIKLLPDYAGPLAFLLDILKELGGAPITEAGFVTLITGLVHKALKYYADRRGRV